VSGPLASWVAEHSRAGWKGRAVLLQYALAANHDGTPASSVTREDLERRIGVRRDAVIAGRKEVLKLGELIQDKAPGGKHNPGAFRVRLVLCPATAGCWVCPILADLLDSKGSATPTLSRGPKGRPQQAKGRSQRPKGRRHRPTTETETNHLRGGTSPHRESAAALAPDGAAAEPGQQEQASQPLEVVPDWRAAIGKPIPDDGERFASRQAEETAKRQRAEAALLVGAGERDSDERRAVSA